MKKIITITTIIFCLVSNSFSQTTNDLDGDGVQNAFDNCPNNYNPSQTDADSDGIGDGCDCTPIISNPVGEKTPSIIINNSAGLNICSGNSVIFTSQIANTTGGYSYSWKKNGVHVSGSPSYVTNTLISGDLITCDLISNIPTCPLGNLIVSNPRNMNVSAISSTLGNGFNYNGFVSTGISCLITNPPSNCSPIAKIEPALTTPFLAI